MVELGGDLSDEVRAALKRATPFIRGEVARQSSLKYAPDLIFRADETFAESARIDALLHEARSRPALGGRDDGDLETVTVMAKFRQKKGRPISGWLCIDKPMGMTSTRGGRLREAGH